MSLPRRAEIEAGLGAVRQRLAHACAEAGRGVDEVALIAVTKTYPATDVLHLAELGVRDIGENRDQEAAPKAAEVASAGAAVRWHFIGRLQRNKCRSVVRYADVVHSVDRAHLVDALAKEAHARRERPLDVLIQVSIDDDPRRGGAVVDAGAGDEDCDLFSVLARAQAAPGLSLCGLMAVAPAQWPPERAFERLAGIAARVRGEYPHARLLSAGMSADLAEAIRYGATHVRVGSAILGRRPDLG